MRTMQYLFIGSDCTEDDFGETLRRKHPEANSADDARVLDEGKTLVLRIEHQSGDILLGHSRKLVVMKKVTFNMFPMYSQIWF